jgi:YggT family protein
VTASGSYLAYWYFHLPNFSSNYIWRFFCRITDPVVRIFAWVTPKAVAPVVLWLFCFVWLFWLRFVFFVVYTALGLVPRVAS